MTAQAPRRYAAALWTGERERRVDSTVFVLVLAAAALHAGWNALLKIGLGDTLRLRLAAGERVVLRDGSLTSVELTQAALDSIERLNPTLNAFVQVDAPVALAQARKADDQRRVGVQLTDQAAEVLAVAPGPVAGILPQALQGLPDDTLERLHLGLAEVIAQLTVRDSPSAGKPLADI